MARTQKLYDRLDQAEREYTLLLRAELESVMRGGLGHYLGSRLRQDWCRMVRSSLDARAAELNALEKEIRQLRAKLKEPLPGEALGVAYELIHRIEASGNWLPSTSKAWLQEVIDKLPSQD